MIKEIMYNGNEYTIEIIWGGNTTYCVRTIKPKIGNFHSIPFDLLDDIEKIKPIIMGAIQDNHDLSTIEKWNGIL
jgi:hypothetical protein